MAPLDLGCVDGAEEVPPEVFAALVLPWQMILKYEVARLIEDHEALVAELAQIFPNTPIIAASALSGEGISSLKNVLKKETSNGPSALARIDPPALG